uniref:Amidase domain-containing protein n=1 Tax=Caenorhabditis japonica TaxID=281687 RepID=A0A8R1HG57_CAEJA
MSEEFENERKEGFETFRKLSAPENLVNDTRLFDEKLTEIEIEELFRDIVALKLHSLIDRLQAKNGLNAYTVLCAYAHKMLESQNRLNCVTEVILEAFDTAAASDKLWYNSEQKPPLYGVPFCVKCNFEIPFVFTNTSQGFFSSNNPHSPYGTTRNPWALDCTPGGSSGGEAALVADGGAPFGSGTDLVGSLRISAAFCGLVTLKPTQNRLHVSNDYGYGFYTRNVLDLILLLKLVIGSPEYRELEPKSSPSPLKFVEKTGKYRIGFFDEDGFNSPVPSNRRAVLDTVDQLKKDGHDVVRFEIENIDPKFSPFHVASMLFKDLTSKNDKNSYLNRYKNEPNDTFVERFATISSLNKWKTVRRVATPIVSRFSKRMALISRARCSSLAEVRKNQEEIEEYRLKFIEYWKSLKIDTLLCPAFCTPAIPHNYPSQLSNTVLSTGLFNLLDFPAGIVPVGNVTAEDMADLSDEKIFPINDLLLKKQREACANSEAMPIAVQVVGLPNEEEIVLEVMKIVEGFNENK